MTKHASIRWILSSPPKIKSLRCDRLQVRATSSASSPPPVTIKRQKAMHLSHGPGVAWTQSVWNHITLHGKSKKRTRARVRAFVFHSRTFLFFFDFCILLDLASKKMQIQSQKVYFWWNQTGLIRYYLKCLWWSCFSRQIPWCWPIPEHYKVVGENLIPIAKSNEFLN